MDRSSATRVWNIRVADLRSPADQPASSRGKSPTDWCTDFKAAAAISEVAPRYSQVSKTDLYATAFVNEAPMAVMRPPADDWPPPAAEDELGPRAFSLPRESAGAAFALAAKFVNNVCNVVKILRPPTPHESEVRFYLRRIPNCRKVFGIS